MKIWKHENNHAGNIAVYFKFSEPLVYFMIDRITNFAMKSVTKNHITIVVNQN